MEIVGKDGEPLKSEGVTNIKASDRTRSHLNAPGNIASTFKGKDDMEEKANKIVDQHIKALIAEAAKDKENGFDINDPQSVMAFDIGYVPIGNTVLVKEVKEEHKIGDLLILDRSAMGQQKAVVICPGLMVNLLKRGDIVTFKVMRKEEAPLATARTFKEVKFMEVEAFIIAGIFQSYEVMQARIEEDFKRMKQLKND